MNTQVILTAAVALCLLQSSNGGLLNNLFDGIGDLASGVEKAAEDAASIAQHVIQNTTSQLEKQIEVVMNKTEDTLSNQVITAIGPNLTPCISSERPKLISIISLAENQLEEFTKMEILPLYGRIVTVIKNVGALGRNAKEDIEMCRQEGIFLAPFCLVNAYNSVFSQISQIGSEFRSEFQEIPSLEKFFNDFSDTINHFVTDASSEVADIVKEIIQCITSKASPI